MDNDGWDQNETEKLIEKVLSSSENRDWDRIAKSFNSKSSQDCENWWYFLRDLDFYFKEHGVTIGETRKRVRSSPAPASPSDQRAPKRFRRSAKLIDRKFKCTVPDCPRAYGTEGALKYHFRTKHKDKSYSPQDTVVGRSIINNNNNSTVRHTPSLPPLMPRLGLPGVFPVDVNGFTMSPMAPELFNANPGVFPIHSLPFRYLHFGLPQPNEAIDEDEHDRTSNHTPVHTPGHTSNHSNTINRCFNPLELHDPNYPQYHTFSPVDIAKQQKLNVQRQPTYPISESDSDQSDQDSGIGNMHNFEARLNDPKLKLQFPPGVEDYNFQCYPHTHAAEPLSQPQE